MDDDESYVDLMKKAASAAVGDKINFKHLQDGQSMLEYLEQVKRKRTRCCYSKPNYLGFKHAKDQWLPSVRAHQK